MIYPDVTSVFGDSVVSQGPYAVIYADPPWPSGRHGDQMSHRKAKSTWAHGCGTWYNTMSVKDLCRLPVAGLSRTNAYLFLWSTWWHLEYAFDIINAWGFDYKTGFPWIKCTTTGTPIFGLGMWARGCSELLLICSRGKTPNIRPAREGITFGEELYSSTRMPSSEVHGSHSKKPHDVRAWIEHLPGPRLEMFARDTHHGWVSWGNEVRHA